MDNYCSDLDAVRYNSHYNWLLENMHMYGFILRYPDDKEDKTKIALKAGTCVMWVNRFGNVFV